MNLDKHYLIDAEYSDALVKAASDELLASRTVVHRGHSGGVTVVLTQDTSEAVHHTNVECVRAANSRGKIAS